MTEPSGFQVMQIFHDPTPNGLINNRIVSAMLDIATRHTTLSEEEKEHFLRILLLVARKMVSVWNHKERYIAEQDRLIAAVSSGGLFPGTSVNLSLSQELFSEFDEFLVQIKSTLDHLVKLPVPMLGRNVWNLRTFGSKGEDVLNALKHNLPEKYKHTAKAFEKVVFRAHRPWLEQTIKLRDQVNHYLDGGLPVNAFGVFKVGEEIKIPMFTKEQSVAQLMGIVWQNLFAFVEDFAVLSISFKLNDGLALFFAGRLQPESPESPWKVTTNSIKDEMIAKPGWQKLE
jgi:hypothetical protein